MFLGKDEHERKRGKNSDDLQHGFSCDGHSASTGEQDQRKRSDHGDANDVSDPELQRGRKVDLRS